MKDLVRDAKCFVALFLLLAGACMQSTLQSVTEPQSEKKVDLKVKGGILLPEDSTEPSPATFPPKQETKDPSSTAQGEPQKKADEEKKTEGDILEMKPGEKDIVSEKKAEDPKTTREETAFPTDSNSVYLETIKNLIPDNRPITIERSDTLTVPQLLEGIAKFGHFNIAVAEGLDSLKISRVNFPNIPLQDAFIAILKRYKLNLTRIGDVLWIDQGNKAGDELVYRVLRLNSISASSLGTQLAQILSGGGSSGSAASAVSASSSGSGSAPAGSSGSSSPNGFFTIHPDSNTIFIRAKPELVEAMTKFITAVDFQGRQVMVEMKIFEVGLDDTTNLGAALSVTDFFTSGDNNADFLSDFLFSADPKTELDSMMPGPEQAGPSGTTPHFLFRVRGGSGDRVQGFLDFLQTIASVDLLSSPRIMAVNGKAAEINIIDKIPYLQSTNTPGVSGPTVTNTVSFEEVGIKLKVTATIQEDKHIRMAVEPEISEEKEKFQNVPVVIKRTSKTEVVVADGETVAIGGLMKNQIKHQEEKVPILGDIPLIGLLFRRSSDTTKKLELLILVTPRLISDDAGAAVLTQEQVKTFESIRQTIRKKH